MNFDTKLFQIINSWVGRSEAVDKLLVYATEYSVAIFSLVFAYYFFKRRKVFWITAVTALLSRGILTELIRLIYSRPRPFVALDNVRVLIEKNGDEPSFPSGHAAYMFAIALAVYLYDKKIGVILMVAALILSVSRIYIGVHYPLDILGGIGVAALSTFLVQKIRKKY